MKSIIGALLLLSFVSLNSGASSLTVPNPLCACDQKNQDPFEKTVQFNFGKFSGQCIDSCRFRPAEILNKSGVKIPGLRSDDVVVANFLHLSKYYMAVIPVKSIDSVEIGFEEFRPMIHHILTRYRLRSGAAIRLYSQSGNGSLVTQADSVVVSFEGVPARGEPYSLLESFMENYILTGRVLSGDELLKTNQIYGHLFKFYPLQLSDEQKGQMFKSAVQQSHKTGLGQVYKLFTNNCSTATLSALNAALELRDNSGLTLVQEALPIDGGPLGLLQALRGRGVLGSDKPNSL